MTQNKISASILSSKKLLYDLKICENMGIDYLHIDWFAEKQINQKLDQIIDYSSIPLDFHVIGYKEDIEQDLIYYKPKYCSFQYSKENEEKIVQLVGNLRSNNIQCGISLCITDNIHILAKTKFDYAMVMNTIPGVSGQQMNVEKSLEYVKLLRDFDPNLSIHLDGGIDNKTKQRYKNLDIRIFVCGSYLFKSQNFYESIFKLKDKEHILSTPVRKYLKKGNNFKIQKGVSNKQLVEKIDTSKSGFVMVIDGERLHGVITDGDVRRLVLNPKSKLVNTEPIICQPTETLFDMYSKISQTEKHIEFIPIVDHEKKILGFVDLNNVNGEINEV